jgi:hypothetical protein
MKWYDPLKREFGKGTDRAYAIVAAALIEDLLERLHIKHFVPPASKEDSLFAGPNAPLGSFSAKIDLAYRLGFISARLCSDLHLLRKIRNRFAHEHGDFDFDVDPICGWIADLTRSHGIFDRNPSIRPIYGGSKSGEFFIATSWIAAFLCAYAEDDVTSFAEEQHSEWGYTTTTFEEG